MKKPTKDQLTSDIVNLSATIRWYQGRMDSLLKSHTDQEIQINTRNRTIDDYEKRVTTLIRSKMELQEHGKLREADLQFIDSERVSIAGKLVASKQANIGWKKQNGRLADTIGELRRNEQRADDAIKSNKEMIARIVAMDTNRDETDAIQRLQIKQQADKTEIIRLDRALSRVCEQRDSYMRQRDIQQTLSNKRAQDVQLRTSQIRDAQSQLDAAGLNLADAVHAKQDADKQRDSYLQEVQQVDRLLEKRDETIKSLREDKTDLMNTVADIYQITGAAL